jgi:hypothetical protein
MPGAPRLSPLQIGAGSLVPSIMLSVYNADMMQASPRAYKVGHLMAA